MAEMVDNEWQDEGRIVDSVLRPFPNFSISQYNGVISSTLKLPTMMFSGGPARPVPNSCLCNGAVHPSLSVFVK